jgi:hypothetical protein
MEREWVCRDWHMANRGIATKGEEREQVRALRQDSALSQKLWARASGQSGQKPGFDRSQEGGQSADG